MNTVLGRCFLYENNSPFSMLKDFLFSFFNIPSASNKELITEILTKEITSVLDESEIVWIPIILNLMGYDSEESIETQTILQDQKERFLFDLICKLIFSRSKEKPLILYFEDVHWMDEKSSQFLEYLISKIPKFTICIIFASRDDIFTSKLVNYIQFSKLEVGNLEKEDAIKLIRESIKLEVPNLELEEQIIKSSECNPFFIDTIIKSIKDNKMLECNKKGTYSIKGNINDINIPNSIKRIILSRIDNIESKENEDTNKHYYPILSEMLNKDFSDTNQITKSLKALESHKIINKKSIDSINYQFRNVSDRDSSYQNLLQGTKSRLNLVLASYLENNSTEDLFSFSERLTLHYFNGEDYEKALFYSIKSAEKAISLFENNEAIIHYQKALEICDILEGTQTSFDADKIFKIRLELLRTYRIVGQYDNALGLSYECLTSKLQYINKSKLYIEMARIYQEMGNIKKAISISEKALTLLGKKVPKNLIQIYISTGVQIVFRLFNNITLIRELTFSTKKIIKYRLQVDTLSILTKIYYFDILEKTAWASALKYNLTEHINCESLLCSSATDFGITMVHSGFKTLGLKHLNRGIELSKNYINTNVYAVCQSRYAQYHLFNNETYKSIDLLKNAIKTFNNIGEMWELMTALGTLGQNYFNISEYEKSINAYLEADTIAKKLDSLTHQAWKYCKVTFINYLKGEIGYDSAIKQLNKGLKISTIAKDNMNICIIYGHLMEMAILENDTEVISELIDSIVNSNKLYRAEFPHIRVSIIYALEGSLKLRNKNNKTILLLKWVNKLIKNHDYLKGSGYRAKSKYYQSIGKLDEAKKFSKLSLKVLMHSPYKRDYALTLIHGAELFKEKKIEYRNEAKEILNSLGLKKEINL